MFLSTTNVIVKYSYAIRRKKILRIKYLCEKNGEIVEHKAAPMDYGTNNPKIRNINEDNLFIWCYDYVNDKTGKIEPILHPIKDYLIVSMEETEIKFNENELTDKIMQKTGLDYRTQGFAFLPDRKWFESGL